VRSDAQKDAVKELGGADVVIVQSGGDVPRKACGRCGGGRLVVVASPAARSLRSGQPGCCINKSRSSERVGATVDPSPTSNQRSRAIDKVMPGRGAGDSWQHFRSERAADALKLIDEPQGRPGRASSPFED